MQLTSPRAAAPPASLRTLLPPLLLFIAAVMLGRWLQELAPPSNDTVLTALALRVSDSLAWLAGTLLAIRWVDVLLWDRLMPRYGSTRIPRLLRQLVAMLLLVAGATAMLSQTWQVGVTAVLATTGVLSLVIGLSLRNILADFFSGIAINLEQPFRLDDFVVLRMRGQREPINGVVREINWRSTRIVTPQDNLISVPNSAVARATIENLSFPSPVGELELEIVLDWALPPALIDAVLGAAMLETWAIGATCGDHPPKCRMCGFDGAGVVYKLIYLIDPRVRAKGPARHALLACVHKHLRFAGLRPVPGAASPMHGLATPPQRGIDHARADDRLAVIEALPLFALLQADERLALAAVVAVQRLAAAVTVVRVGEPGSSMFIVAAGVLEVWVTPPGAASAQRSATLAPGDFFGEMSLFTGAPRSATVSTLGQAVLYEVPKAAIAELLISRPELADAFSQVVTEHEHDDAAAAAAVAASPSASDKPPGLADLLAARIRGFFGR